MMQFEAGDNAVLRRGRWMESAVKFAVEELRPEWKLRAPNVYLRDPKLRLGCTPDFYIDGDPRGLGVLQAKSVAPSVYERDDDINGWDGGKRVPPFIAGQAAVEAMITDAAFCVVAALVVDPFNMDCVIHELPRRSDVEENIRATVKKFWADVAAGNEPAPDYSKDHELIRRLYAAETAGKVFDASGDNHLPVLLEERCTLQDFIKDADARVNEIDAEIKHKMGDAESIVGLDGFRVTFKSTNRVAYTVPAKTIRSLRVLDKRQKETQ